MITIAGILRKCLLINIMIANAMFAFAQSNKSTNITQTPSPVSTPKQPPSNYTSGINVNYVRTCEAMGPCQDPNTMITAGYQHTKEGTQYFDGLGRPLQTVVRQTNPGASPKDLVSTAAYDEGLEPISIFN